MSFLWKIELHPFGLRIPLYMFATHSLFGTYTVLVIYSYYELKVLYYDCSVSCVSNNDRLLV